MLTVPGLRQKFAYDCGPTCAEAVARFWKHPRGRLRACLPATATDGLDPRTLEAGFRAEGFDVVCGEMLTGDLKWFTRSGRPVICAVRSHWVVVVGVARGSVHYHDPDAGPARKREADWREYWTEGERDGIWDRFGLVAWR